MEVDVCWGVRMAGMERLDLSNWALVVVSSPRGLSLDENLESRDRRPRDGVDGGDVCVLEAAEGLLEFPESRELGLRNRTTGAPLSDTGSRLE